MEPARTVLALHGFPESAWEWVGVAESLAGQGVRVLAPMQRGYSPGARPDGVDAYAIEHLADDVLGDRSALTGALNWYRAMRRYELPGVSVPTTYLWGDQDPAISRSGAEATAARMAGEYRFVPRTDRATGCPRKTPRWPRARSWNGSADRSPARLTPAEVRA